MAGPIIPEVALDDLQALQESSLRDRAVVERWIENTADNGETRRTLVVVEAAAPVFFVPLGSKTAELAAAMGIVTHGVLKQRVSGDIRPGDRVLIRGVRSRVRFWRLMDVGPALQTPARTVRRMTVTDSDLSRG